MLVLTNFNNFNETEELYQYEYRQLTCTIFGKWLEYDADTYMNISLTMLIPTWTSAFVLDTQLFDMDMVQSKYYYLVVAFFCGILFELQIFQAVGLSEEMHFAVSFTHLVYWRLSDSIIIVDHQHGSDGAIGRLNILGWYRSDVQW